MSTEVIPTSCKNRGVYVPVAVARTDDVLSRAEPYQPAALALAPGVSL